MIIVLLIVINIGVFFMIRNGRIDYEDLTISYHDVFNRKQYYRLITNGFAHVDPSHLVCNMLSLYSVGTWVNQTLGTINTLVVYFVSLVGSSIFSLLMYHKKRKDYSNSLGASGAIFGLEGVYFMVVLYFYGIGALSSMSRFLITSVIMSIMPGINGYSHLGGFAIGIIYTYVYIFAIFTLGL